MPMCAKPKCSMIKSHVKNWAVENLIKGQVRLHTEERGRDEMKSRALALIVAGPGRFRDSLRALLAAAPQIKAVNKVDDASSALRAVAEHHPDLVLLDGSLSSNEIWTVLRQIKVEQPQTRCIVLGDNGRQQQEARAAGADAILIKGFSATKLFQVIERLLE